MLGVVFKAIPPFFQSPYKKGGKRQKQISSSSRNDQYWVVIKNMEKYIYIMMC
jgi:hypothetical protein